MGDIGVLIAWAHGGTWDIHNMTRQILSPMRRVDAAVGPLMFSDYTIAGVQVWCSANVIHAHAHRTFAA